LAVRLFVLAEYYELLPVSWTPSQGWNWRVGVQRRKFSRKFKLGAVRLVKDRGVRFHREAPGHLAGGMAMRGAGCLPVGFSCLAQPQPQRPLAVGRSAGDDDRSQLQEQRDRTYGARRAWHDVLAEGLNCGLHCVERLMRENGLRARPRRRGLPRDTGERATISDNILDRALEAAAPNQKWIADFTYIWTAEGWLYVAAVVNLFSRRVVGWAMKAEMTADLSP